MPTFEYEAVSPANRTRHKGVIEAASMEEALLRLATRKIFPSYFAELSTAQAEVVNRIANFKKLARSTAEVVEEPELPVIIPKKREFKMDWTYIIIAGIVITLVLWAITRA